MVYKIINSKYWIFVETLIYTALILLVGILIGFGLENWRTGKVIGEYKSFEVETLDLRLQNYYFQIMDKATCDEALKQNLDFADRLYSEGIVLQKYEDLNQLTNEKLLLEKKRYVLLKTELWLNSILLKEKCKGKFHTVVYVYTQFPDNVKKAEQEAVSQTLLEIKGERENNIILIPIAGDLNLNIVNLQERIYNVTYYPSVIIDEKYVLEGFKSKSDTEKYLT